MLLEGIEEAVSRKGIDTPTIRLAWLSVLPETIIETGFRTPETFQ